jgi:hypothetical protein
MQLLAGIGERKWQNDKRRRLPDLLNENAGLLDFRR